MAKNKVNNKKWNAMQNLPQKQPLPVVGYTLKINKELYQALCEEADKRGGISLSDLMIEAMACGIGREELGYVPKKKMGRPRGLHPVPAHA